ncbi:MAG TPA: lysozyme [Burkholderiaceae bacterium]|nr:lysozyme [Burkholderiaceae bacterium]
MSHSRELRDFVAGWETLALVAYPATEEERKRNIWTIGYGHTKGVKEGDTCTREQAEAWLDEDLEAHGAELRGFMTRTPTQQQYDALLSLGFNVGITGKDKLGPSGTMRLFNEGKDQECADRMLLWNKQGGVVLRGLIHRRAAEHAIYVQADYTGRP